MCSLGVGELSVCVGVGCETSPGLVVTALQFLSDVRRAVTR